MDLAYLERVLGDRPAAYWPLMETQGLTAFDWKGGNHGTIHGGVTLGQPSAPGLPGTAMAFDGSTGYCVADNSADAWIQNGSMSLEMWANIPNNPSGYGFLAGIRDGNNGEFYVLQLSGTNSLETRFTNSAGTHYDFDGSPDVPTWEAATWNHGVLAYDAQAQALTFYSNGRPVASRSATGTITASGLPIQIGAQSGPGNFFGGTLTHVAIYPYALTPNQVQAHYFARPRDLIS